MKSTLQSFGKDMDDFDYNISGNEIEYIMPDHYKWVDSGRGPGKQPPLEKIAEWTIRKGIPEKAAFPIARKIGQEGIAPSPFLHHIDEDIDDILDNDYIDNVVIELKNKLK